MHGCMHYKKHPLCPPNAPDVNEMISMVEKYTTARFYHALVRYEAERELAKERQRFNVQLMQAERELRMAGEYYATAFISGPCSMCGEAVCHERECRRRTAARMPICASGVDLKWATSHILDVPARNALSYWRTNLSKKFYEGDESLYLCLGMILL